MAENESNGGKDLAYHQKVKENFEREIIAKKNKIKSENTSINPLIDIQIVQREDGKYDLILLGEKIGSLDENDSISYNINGLKAVKEKLESSNRPPVEYSDLGLPDIEYLEYLEKERNRKLQEEQGNQGKQEQIEEGEEEPGDEEQAKEDEEEGELEETQEESKGLLELNLAVLELINPKLRGCTAVYLNPRTNSLVIKDKFGKERSPEEFGFEEKRVEGGNFALSKMNEEGEISSKENPTKLYAIKGSDYAITTDFKTHNREVNIAVKGRDENHGNSYSILKGNLAKFDSGDISKYQGQERAGILEGWDAGEKEKTNETAQRILEGLSSDDKKKFEQGFADKVSDEHRMNDKRDLKETVKEILIKEYKERAVSAEEIAAKMVDENKNYYQVKEEREAEGRGPWEGPNDPRRA